MSGCHDTNVKCCRCEELEDIINVLNYREDNSRKRITPLENKIEILSDKCNRLKAHASTVNKAVFDINERLDKLEEVYEDLTKFGGIDYRINNHECRLDKLEKNNKPSESKPHVCPVCDGLKVITTKPVVTEPIIMDGVKCEAGSWVFAKQPCATCEGKGIVWSS